MTAAPIDRTRLTASTLRVALRRSGAPRRATVGAPGSRPVRVLLVGAGLAAGPGARDHDDALAGALARALSAGTGRGVEVEVRVAPLLPSALAAARLRRIPAGWDAVVFAPCFVEPALPGPGLTRHAAAAVDALLEVAGEGRVVLLQLPCPARFSAPDLAAARTTAAGNRALLAQRGERVLVVQSPDLGSWADERPFDAAYWSEAADRIARALLDPAAGGR